MQEEAKQGFRISSNNTDSISVKFNYKKRDLTVVFSKINLIHCYNRIFFVVIHIFRLFISIALYQMLVLGRNII